MVSTINGKILLCIAPKARRKETCLPVGINHVDPKTDVNTYQSDLKEKSNYCTRGTPTLCNIFKNNSLKLRTHLCPQIENLPFTAFRKHLQAVDFIF